MATKPKRIDPEEESLPSIQPPVDVVAFNELRSCADLFRLYDDGTLDIQPPYQREVVWNSLEQSLFIDSLMKQLPSPSMCFSLDFKTQKWQVVDGLQRMTAIVSFLSAKKPWRISQTEEIEPSIAGKTNFDLRDGNEQEQILYRRVQNISLPITVIRCDSTRDDHSEYLFTIFHRLNSGGKQLNHQEIRNCIFSGPFNDHLRSLDSHKKWEILKKRLPSKGSRFRSAELILRFFSLHERASRYSGNLPRFLNDYMREMRFSKQPVLKEQEQLFENVISEVNRGLANQNDLAISYTLLEAIMIGVAHDVEKVKTTNTNELGRKIARLADSFELSSADAKVGTTKASKVRDRVRKAREIFSE
jgi:hypothetical protein